MWAKVKTRVWAMGCYGVCGMRFSGVVCNNGSLLVSGRWREYEAAYIMGAQEVWSRGASGAWEGSRDARW